MNLKEKIETNYKTVFKEQKRELIDIYRNLKAEILKFEKSTGKSITDNEVITTLNKYANQRKESIKVYTEVGKLDEAKKEQFELEVVQSFLPSLLSDDEVVVIVKGIIASGNYTSPKDMGKIINEFKANYNGQADGKVLADIVKNELNKPQ